MKSLRPTELGATLGLALALVLQIGLFGMQSIVIAATCGVERWSVKSGTDPDASRINLSSTTTTTIASLTGLPAPSPIPVNNRVQPTETTVFSITATLTGGTHPPRTYTPTATRRPTASPVLPLGGAACAAC